MDPVPPKSTTELILSAIDDVLQLIRKELELLRAGLVESFSSRAMGIGLIALAVFAILPGLLFLVIALALALPVSAATGFAIVGFLLLVFAGGGIWFGAKRAKKGSPASKEALDKVKEDARWVREQVRR